MINVRVTFIFATLVGKRLSMTVHGTVSMPDISDWNRSRAFPTSIRSICCDLLILSLVCCCMAGCTHENPTAQMMRLQEEGKEADVREAVKRYLDNAPLN